MRLLGKVKRDELYRVLKNKFGFNGFRHRQKATIVAILLGHDAFVLMPTGKEHFFLNKINFESYFFYKKWMFQEVDILKYFCHIYLSAHRTNRARFKEQFLLKNIIF